MAKLTLDGVTITKVTLDGVTVNSVTLDGIQIYSVGAVYEDIYNNGAWVGAGINGALNDTPDNHIGVYADTDMSTIDYGDGTFGILFNPENSAVSKRAFEYHIANTGFENAGLVVGETYRFECDVYTYDAGTGDGGTDHTRGGGPVGMTIDSFSAVKTVGEWTTHHVEFTVDNATYALRIRYGTGLDNAADTGKFEIKNPRLFDLDSPIVQTYTHSMTVWHGTNSAGMDASVPGGSVTPLPVAAGEADVTRITSIASGAPQMHVLGTQDVGSYAKLTFEGGITFEGTGVEHLGTHTKFVGANDGDALYNYLAAEEGNSIDFDIEFTPFVPTFVMTHTITPGVSGSFAGFNTSGTIGAIDPLAVAPTYDNMYFLGSTSGGSAELRTLGTTGEGNEVTVKFDGGNLSFNAIGAIVGGNVRYVGGADLNDAIYDYLVANDGVEVDIQIIHNEWLVPSPNIHDMPVVDYNSQTGTVLHVDHTGDADVDPYTTGSFGTDYDQDWETLTNVSLESGRLKCTVDAGEYKKGIQSGGNLATDYDELYMTYEFEFAPGFDFVLGGKMPGLSGRPGMTGSHADGCNAQGQDGGFSARMMFRPNGQLEGYFYHEDQPGGCGHQISFVDGSVPFKVRNGTQYLMEIRVKMNTPGNRDGIVECKINGVQVLRKANFRFSNNGSHGINHKFIQMWHGGNSPSWAPSQDSTFYMNHMRIATDPLTYTLP